MPESDLHRLEGISGIEQIEIEIEGEPLRGKPELPVRYDSVRDLRTGLLRHTDRSPILASYEVPEGNVDIAIVDSVYELESLEGWDPGFDTIAEEDYTESDDEVSTSIHGWHISNLISFFIDPERVTFHTYRVVNEDEEESMNQV
ncbi:MAG: hypothetical protein U5K70_04430 [Halodesulfurarchaeum sp.]|nr:hypothetical protein [Halodesulfurarchaeum sp.]